MEWNLWGKENSNGKYLPVIKYPPEVNVVKSKYEIIKFLENLFSDQSSIVKKSPG